MYSRYYEFDIKEAAYEVGKLFKQDVQKHVMKEFPAELIKGLEKIQKTLPTIYEEIVQSAKGADVSLEEMFSVMAYEFYSAPFHFDRCTDITAILEDGRIVKGHNEDLNGTISNTAIIKRKTENGWFTEIGYEDCISGSTVFYNSAGLLVSGNFIYSDDYNFENYPTSIVLRLMVECKNIKEMEEVWKKYPSMSSFNLNVYDQKINKAYNFEFTPYKVDIKEVKDVSIHTNHLLYTQDDTYTTDQESSRYRYLKSIELSKKGIHSIEDVATILEYEGEDYYSSIHKVAHKDNSLTCFLLLYDSKKQEIILKDYLSNEVYTEKWRIV